jgi:diadenosine tetraphosphate (Ap4A) HIT family hydrolase
MPTLFTRILAGEIPGRFVWRDDRAAAFLTIAPLRPGHVLVVPREEIDHWLDLPPDLAAHLITVAQKVGRAVQRAFPAKKVGLLVAGLEVPHVHLHVTPIDGVHDLDFDRQDRNADPRALDEAAERIRAALRDLGHGEFTAAGK